MDPRLSPEGRHRWLLSWMIFVHRHCIAALYLTNTIRTTSVLCSRCQNVSSSYLKTYPKSYKRFQHFQIYCLGLITIIINLTTCLQKGLIGTMYLMNWFADVHNILTEKPSILKRIFSPGYPFINSTLIYNFPNPSPYLPLIWHADKFAMI